MTPSAATDGASQSGFSPIDNELPLRWFRRLRIVPANGLGAGRRAAFLALLTWRPIVVWATLTRRLWNGATGEQQLQHYGVHVRCLVVLWFWRLGRLDLSLVPTHPDRTGGLAFVEKLPGAFSMVAFALSAMVASRWAHEIVYHEATLQSFKLPAAGFVVLWALLLLLPVIALAPALVATRARAIPAYAALVGEQGRLVHRRWILREHVGDEPILDAPGIGPIADAAAMYQAVRGMRSVPIGKSAILKIIVPIALPLLVVAALQIPLKELLLKVVKALL
jgi:hypothetical protein